jgi:hypothetical protein
METIKNYKKGKIKFITKANEKYGSLFSYDNIEYYNSITPVYIKCNTHNILFSQIPSEHLRGKKKCVLCGGPVKNITDFLIKSKNKHGDKYDYSKVEYIDSKTKVSIICPEHGEFNQLPNGHYKSGCQKCFLDNNNKCDSFDDFLIKSKNKHGDKYDYSKVNYINSHTKVSIICSEHGEFEQLASKHVYGQGCKQCGILKTKTDLTLTLNEFIDKCELRHGKYDYSKVNYINSHTKVSIICPEHGEFKQVPYDHLDGHGCIKCVPKISSFELEINDYITNELRLNTIISDRSILNGKELDIYIPSKNLAIEFNGLYWHSELFKSKNYHLNKTKLCNDKDIKLIHIFEDEWLYKQDIVKSRLRNILGLTNLKIYGRKCIIKELSTKDINKFLSNNHLQGAVRASINLGLYYNNELVSVMTFNKPRLGIGVRYDGYELSRFANILNTTVIGGASKLVKHFIKIYKPKEIRSYADIRWSDGDLYKTLGFTETHRNKPNYWYINGLNRLHRFNFRKHKLKEEGFDISKTEHEIMLERKIYRIYDCGTISYSLVM